MSKPEAESRVAITTLPAEYASPGTSDYSFADRPPAKALTSQPSPSPAPSPRSLPSSKSEFNASQPSLALLLLGLGAALLATKIGHRWWKQRAASQDDLLPPKPVLPTNPHTAIHDPRYLRAILQAERQGAPSGPVATSRETGGRGIEGGSPSPAADLQQPSDSQRSIGDSERNLSPPRD